MFIVSHKDDNFYRVLDTKDMVEETLTRDEIYSACCQGLFVFGVNDFSIENNIDLRVILRLYDSENDIQKDYDGILCRDAVEDINEDYTVQVMHINDYPELVSNEEVRLRVLSCIEYINSFRVKYDMYSKSDESLYKVASSDIYGADIVDKSTSVSYRCDFFDLLYIYLVEHESVEGITSITLDTIILDNADVLYKGDCLLKYFIDDELGDNIKSSFDTNFRRLDFDFGLDEYKFVNSLPFFNLKRFIYQGADDGVYPLFKEYSNKVVVSADIHGVYFDDGSVLKDAEVVIKYLNCFKYANDIAVRLTNEFIDKEVAKELLINETSFLKNLQTVHSDINISDGGRFMHLDHMCGVYCGKVFELKRRLSDNKKIWMTRLTNLGSAWVNTELMGTEFGIMLDFNKGSGQLCNDEFLRLMDSDRVSKMLWLEDIICPLGVYSISKHDEGINFNILCLVSGSVNEWTKTGLYTIIVPLLYCGGCFEDFGSYFRYNMLIEDLYLEKDLVYDDLVAKYNSGWSNYLGGFITTNNTKKFKEYKKYSESHYRNLIESL